MKVIGLTGGIASGKSTASNILKEMGIPIIDADQIAREIVQVGKPALEEIKNTFGPKVIFLDGTLNRKLLGKIVFSDEDALRKLNSITHRRIIKEILNRIDIYIKSDAYPVIIVDAALLIEMDMIELVDEIWLVTIDEETQLTRLMERDYLDLADAKNRISAQMSIEKKKKYAHVLIDNNQDLFHLKKQLEKQLRSIRR